MDKSLKSIFVIHFRIYLSFCTAPGHIDNIPDFNVCCQIMRNVIGSNMNIEYKPGWKNSLVKSDDKNFTLR